MWIETEIKREKDMERNAGTAVETFSEIGMAAENGTGARAKDGLGKSGHEGGKRYKGK